MIKNGDLKIKKEGVLHMKIGIIGAMEEEVELLKQEMQIKNEREIAGCHYYEGTLKGKSVILTLSGIGKVNASVATTILHDYYEPTIVINTGSAGGFAKELEVGDVVISSEVAHHDVDVTAFNYEYGQVPGMPARYSADVKLVKVATEATSLLEGVQSVQGLIATGDSFMDDSKRVEHVRTIFPEMQAAEMEAAAVAQVCHKYNTPFVIIRSLSDIAGKESSISFDQYLTVAAKNAATLIMNMVEEL